MTTQIGMILCSLHVTCSTSHLKVKHSSFQSISDLFHPSLDHHLPTCLQWAFNTEQQCTRFVVTSDLWGDDMEREHRTFTPSYTQFSFHNSKTGILWVFCLCPRRVCRMRSNFKSCGVRWCESAFVGFQTHGCGLDGEFAAIRWLLWNPHLRWFWTGVANLADTSLGGDSPVDFSRTCLIAQELPCTHLVWSCSTPSLCERISVGNFSCLLPSIGLIHVFELVKFWRSEFSQRKSVVGCNIFRLSHIHKVRSTCRLIRAISRRWEMCKYTG